MQKGNSGSMPENKYAFGFEVVLGLDQMLCEVLAIVLYFCPQIVDHEWFWEVVFVVCIRHRLEVKGHGRTALQISELVATSGGVTVGIKEPSNWLAVLWEIWVVKTLVPLLIEVNNVVGERIEESFQFFVGKNGIEHPDFINGWLRTFVPDACSGNKREESKVDLPDECLVKHHERQTSPGEQATSPCVIRSVQTSVDLIHVVTCAHSPFPVVVLPQVGRVLELVWVTLSLCWCSSFCSMDWCNVVHVVVIKSIGWCKSLVIERRICVSSELTARHVEQRTLLLQRMRLGNTYDLAKRSDRLHHF